MDNIFKNILKGKVVIVGVGNTLRADDSFGPTLVERLKNDTDIVCIDVGVSPENYASKIAKETPDTILIADAVHMGLKPGEYNILEPSEIVKSGLTTHDISPKMFLDYLQSQTKANIYMLGIQPENLSFDQKMSASIEDALGEITTLIKEASHA